jgi:hypothetical protein
MKLRPRRQLIKCSSNMATQNVIQQLTMLWLGVQQSLLCLPGSECPFETSQVEGLDMSSQCSCNQFLPGTRLTITLQAANATAKQRNSSLSVCLTNHNIILAAKRFMLQLNHYLHRCSNSQAVACNTSRGFNSTLS